MPDRKLEFAWMTDTGRVRTLNEDTVKVYPDMRLVVVADGIGGSSAGEIASGLAAQVIGDCYHAREHLPKTREEAREAIRQAVLEANRRICDSSRRTARYSGMGTTVVTGYIGPDWMVFGHVGDSRLYLLRDHQLYQLTRDHSLIQEVVDQGFFPTLEDAQRYGIRQNILTRGLGSNEEVGVDVGDINLAPDDTFLFCTDGLSGMVSDRHLQKALIAHREKNLETLGQHLIKLAYQGGGADNITLALIRVY